jgi:hypothetical protein
VLEEGMSMRALVDGVVSTVIDGFPVSIGGGELRSHLVAVSGSTGVS